jgi:ferric-dicitrate binding protein FerR (iron transport regulator)
MNRPEWHSELSELCEAVIEDRLTAAQRDRIEQLIAAHPEAKRFYVEYLHQHACLAWSAAQPDLQRGTRSAERGTEDTTPTPPEPMPASRPSRRRWLAVAASLLIVAVGFWLVSSRGPGQLATLVHSKGCKWDGGTLPTEEGARLGPGRLRLAEGITRIVFDNGAELTLEAPADLELVSGQRCVLRGGRLVAKVPGPAIGFTVDTPTAVFRDLGTEFGINVRDEKTADLQVFTGLVDAKLRSSGEMQRVQTGQNRRFASDNVSDFDPQAEQPASPEPTPKPVGVDDRQLRIVHISTAIGRGKDRYVQPLFPSPHSSDILLLVKKTKPDSSDYTRKAYIGLDLASIAGMKVVDAQLSFTFTPTGLGFASEVPDATFAVYGVTDESLDNWDERAMRWSNAPANKPGGSGVDLAKTVLLGKFEISQGTPSGTRSISGERLADFLNSDTNQMATFILVRETAGSGRTDYVHGFANKNHPTLPPPTLKLAVVPR